MLYDFIFLVILFALFYSYLSSQQQFAATASAIGQVWSGSCHLSCQRSHQSGFSGLSGLPGPANAGTSQPGPGEGNGQIRPNNSMPGHSRACNCESCPCALVENFLRTCRPATNIYAELMQCISNYVTYFLQMMEDAYFYMMRVFECNLECQRQVQITSTREHISSDENFSFGKGDKENKVDHLKSAIKSQPSINISPPAKTLERDVVPAKNSVPEPTQQWTSKDVPRNIPENSDDSVIEKEKGVCSKCIEKGRTCLKECPRASKTDKK